MKVAVEIYKGIEYIQISTLPQDQRNEIMKSLSDRLIIKILRNNDSLLRDCVQYHNYEFWYENIFSRLKVAEKQPITEPISSLMLSKLALQES